MFLSQGRECFKNPLNLHPSSKHLKNLPDHDSCAFEGGLAVADFAVSDDMLGDFGSHSRKGGSGVSKPILECGAAELAEGVGLVFEELEFVVSGGRIFVCYFPVSFFLSSGDSLESSLLNAPFWLSCLV